MSMQRNIQNIRSLISSAPSSSTPRKHVHFRETYSAETQRRNAYKTSSERSSIQNGSRFSQDYENYIFQNNNLNTLNSGSTSTTNTPQSGYSQSFYRSPEDLLARGDFIAHQSANATDFLNYSSQTRPKRVSEICLVNDHYILVKIPAIHWQDEQNMDTIAEEECSTIENCEQKRGFLRYFPCQRNGRVLPAAIIDKEAETTASAGASKTRSILRCPLAHCWRVNEKSEVFESRTKMFGVFWRQRIPGKVITIQPSKNDKETPLDLRMKSVHIAANDTLVGENNNQVDIGVFGSPLHTSTPSKVTTPPVFNGALQTSLHEAVILEQHATWINDDKPVLKECVDNKKSLPSAVVNKSTKARRRTSVLHWFLKRPKIIKQKSKIHAVVYKTYFVRWKKPPVEMCPHCGRARDKEVSAIASCKSRRCHSATF